jgi:5,10-methylenetetrahydrofolate reductase
MEICLWTTKNWNLSPRGIFEFNPPQNRKGESRFDELLNALNHEKKNRN